MRNYILPFILGFLASTFLFLILLHNVEIPTYIFEVECKPELIV